MSCCNSFPSRRTFFAASGAATAAVALAACTSPQEQDTYSSGELTRALALKDLAPGEAVQMAVGADQMLIYRERDDVVHAYSAVCTHQGCIVGVHKDDSASPFICPCHASNFDKLTGDAIAGPAQRPLTRHETAIESGWILVNVTPAAKP